MNYPFHQEPLIFKESQKAECTAINTMILVLYSPETIMFVCFHEWCQQFVDIWQHKAQRLYWVLFTGYLDLYIVFHSKYVHNFFLQFTTIPMKVNLTSISNNIIMLWMPMGLLSSFSYTSAFKLQGPSWASIPRQWDILIFAKLQSTLAIAFSLIQLRFIALWTQ
jgi:hypothetical protein